MMKGLVMRIWECNSIATLLQFREWIRWLFKYHLLITVPASILVQGFSIIFCQLFEFFDNFSLVKNFRFLLILRMSKRYFGNWQIKLPNCPFWRANRTLTKVDRILRVACKVVINCHRWNLGNVVFPFLHPPFQGFTKYISIANVEMRDEEEDSHCWWCVLLKYLIDF